jgi:DNA-binding SARP family transcriptional activator
MTKSLLHFSTSTPITMSATLIAIRLLGQYTVTVAGQPCAPLPTERSRLLFAYLAFHSAPQPRSHLIGLLWPDLPEKQARRRLTQEMWRINSELSKVGLPITLAAQGDAIQFADGVEVVCDAHQFHTLLERCRVEHSTAWPSLAELTAFLGGELLPGYFDDWILVARERLFQAYSAALMRLLSQCKQLGDWDTATVVVDALRQHDPLSEAWIAESLRLALNLGRREASLQQYKQFVVTLQEALGVAPSSELAALSQQVAALRGQPSTPVSFVDPAYLAPMLGREAERSLLLRALQRTQESCGQFCLLEGEAGVGKSRLIESVIADARWRGLLIGSGKGLEIQRNQAYQPLLQALSELLSPLRAQQMRVLIDPLWLAQAARVLPVLAEWLPDLPPPPLLDPEPDRVRTLEALTRLLLALAELRPTVLVVDDLQWADNATLDLLIYLARRVSNAPLLVLLSYRAEEARTDAAIWLALHEIDRSSSVQRIELAGISAEASAELVRTLLQLEQPAPVFERRIFTQTRGNPFFILETLRTLYQEGSLTRTADGHWQTPWDAATVDYHEVAIPAQVDALIRRRLAQLAPEERRVLDIAAVLGAPFDLATLAHFLPDSRRHLLAAATLVRRRFLQETPTAYQFEHDQIRQTVYAQIEPAQRRDTHRRAGEVLAHLQPDAHTLLAHHFEQAGATGRAFHHQWKAGEGAQQTGAYRLARTHYAKAVDWLDELPVINTVRVELLMQWERLLSFLGERNTQRETLAKLAQTPGLDVRQQRVALLRQALAEGDAGDFDSALMLAAESLTIAQRMNDSAGTVETLTVWGQMLHHRGDAAAAEAKLRQAVDTVTGDVRLQAEAWSTLADILPARNDYTAAVEAAESALVRFQQIGDIAGAARANVTLAVVAMEQGDVAGAAARFLSAQVLAEQCGYRLLEARIATNLANALCVLGRIGEALRQSTHALAIGQALGDVRLESLIAVNYASMHITFVGPDDVVAAQMRRALAWGEAAGDDLCVGQAWNILSMDAAYRGDLVRARELLDRSAAAFARVDYAYIKAQALRSQAQLCQMESAHAQALELIRQALVTSQQIGATHLTTEMRAIEGEILLDCRQIEAALAAVNEAAAQVTPAVFQSYLLHYRCFKVWRAASEHAAAQQAMRRALQEFNAILETLSPEQRQKSRTNVPAHRGLLADA